MIERIVSMQFYSIVVVVGLSAYFWTQIQKAEKDGVLFPGTDNGRFVRELRRETNPAEFNRKVLVCKLFISFFFLVGMIMAFA